MRKRSTIYDLESPGGTPSNNSDKKRPSLIVLAGRDFGRQYFLTQSETTIGRDEICTIQLSDSRVSRRHAKIVSYPGTKADPRFRIIDLDSTNGTFLNDRRISEAALAEGDRVRIGYTILKYAVRDVVEIEHDNKIYRMATTDALTRLHSREYFFQQYSDLFHRSERYQRPFALMMVDIDDFKSINDTYGHPAGDHVLEGIGRIILDIIRHEDFAARYGGEEFIILLPETNAESALNPAERLRRSIKAYQFKAGSKEFSVAVSIGIAEYPEDGATMSELLANADQALYMAKRAGKNSARLFRPKTQEGTQKM